MIYPMDAGEDLNHEGRSSIRRRTASGGKRMEEKRASLPEDAIPSKSKLVRYMHFDS